MRDAQERADHTQGPVPDVSFCFFRSLYSCISLLFSCPSFAGSMMYVFLTTHTHTVHAHGGE